MSEQSLEQFGGVLTAPRRLRPRYIIAGVQRWA
jgi:hypothetical protein